MLELIIIIIPMLYYFFIPICILLILFYAIEIINKITLIKYFKYLICTFFILLVLALVQ